MPPITSLRALFKRTINDSFGPRGDRARRIRVGIVKSLWLVMIYFLVQVFIPFLDFFPKFILTSFIIYAPRTLGPILGFNGITKFIDGAYFEEFDKRMLNRFALFLILINVLVVVLGPSVSNLIERYVPRKQRTV